MQLHIPRDTLTDGHKSLTNLIGATDSANLCHISQLVNENFKKSS